MTWIVLQFVFLLLPVFLPMVLYRSRRPFMAAFYRAMTGNAKARKLYTQVLVVLLLLFHYVYTTGHPGQFGTVLSTVVSAMLFSSRRTERWLRKLLDRPRAFVFCGIMASGCPVLSLRQDTVRMGGQGQEVLPVGASGCDVRLLPLQSSREAAMIMRTEAALFNPHISQS